VNETRTSEAVSGRPLPRYPAALRVLHWALALAVCVQLALILVLHQLRSVEFAAVVLALHRSCGTAVWLLALIRVGLGVAIHPPAADRRLPGWQRLAAQATHAGLIALVLAQPVIGVLQAWSRGDVVRALWLFDLPQFLTFTDPQATALKLAHRWTADVLIGLIGLHVAAVVFNQLVRNIPVMPRMMAAARTDRLTHRISLALQLAAGCAGLLALSAASGLFAASQYRAFGDARDRFDQTEVATLDDMRTALAGVAGLDLPQDAGERPAFAARAGKVAADLEDLSGRATDLEARRDLLKAEAGLRAAAAGAPPPSGLARVQALAQAAVDAQTNAVLQGRLAMAATAARGHDLIVLVLAPAVLAGAVLSFLLSRSVLSALSRARQAILAIETGARRESVEVAGSGEFAELMRDVMRLRERVEAREREIAARQLEAQSQVEHERLAKESAEAANRAKSEFLAMMSHEIRTPLNGVLGMAQAMAADELSDAQRAKLEVIGQSGEALLAILNDVLDLSKIEAGKLELEAVEFDLEELVRKAHASFLAVADKKGLELGLALGPGIGGIYRGDPMRVRQVLSNLLSNALKFTVQGEVRITAERTGAQVRLSVSDTGIGVPADRIEHLFDKFVQADSSTTRTFGGTGLGLAICRELCEAMGGRITVASKPGQGSRFTAEVPLERIGDAPAAVAQEAAPEPLGGAALRILAAEDNAVNQLVLNTLLGQAGIEPRIVDNGAEALAAWEAEAWDVILMDVQMPVMDGPTATGEIRRRERETGRARTPIIALTANAMTHQLESYRAAGMESAVAKPIRVEELFAAIAQATDPGARAPAVVEAAV